jgi:hypothetical protein
MATDGSAPPGNVLITSGVYYDGAVQFRNGGSVTQAAGNTATFNGTVNLSGSANIGQAPINDLTEVISPSAAGLLAWNFPYVLAQAGSSAVIIGGTLYLAKLPLAAGTVVTNLWMDINTAAVTPTTGQNFGGLYSAAGALLATTSDLTTAIGTNTGPIECPLSAAYTVQSSANYYIGFSLNAATLPKLECYLSQGTITTGVVPFGSTTTFGNTAAKYPFAVNTTGNTTALPTSLTMSSNTATGSYAYWVAVN